MITRSQYTLIRASEEYKAIRDIEELLGKPIPLKREQECYKIAHGQVTSLTLNDQGLIDLPGTFVNLLGLRYLDLRNNNFDSFVPTPVCDLRRKNRYFFLQIS